MLPKSLRPLFPYLRKYRGSYFIGHNLRFHQ